MKFYLISDNPDTQMGLRTVGIEGVTAHTPDDVKTQLERVLADETIGVVLITEALAQRCGELIYEIKTSVSRPLILEIPDRGGSHAGDSITRYVREAVGLKF